MLRILHILGMDYWIISNDLWKKYFKTHFIRSRCLLWLSVKEFQPYEWHRCGFFRLHYKSEESERDTSYFKTSLGWHRQGCNRRKTAHREGLDCEVAWNSRRFSMKEKAKNHQVTIDCDEVLSSLHKTPRIPTILMNYRVLYNTISKQLLHFIFNKSEIEAL